MWDYLADNVGNHFSENDGLDRSETIKDTYRTHR